MASSTQHLSHIHIIERCIQAIATTKAFLMPRRDRAAANYWAPASEDRSLWLDTGFHRDLTPLGDVATDPFAQLFGRARSRQQRLESQGFLHARIGDRGPGFLVHSLD